MSIDLTKRNIRNIMKNSLTIYHFLPEPPHGEYKTLGAWRKRWRDGSH